MRVKCAFGDQTSRYLIGGFNRPGCSAKCTPTESDVTTYKTQCRCKMYTSDIINGINKARAFGQTSFEAHIHKSTLTGIFY